MVEFEFTGTGIRVFSPTVPTPDSYELYVDGKRVSERAGSSPTSDSQVLLGSITGLEMAPHTVTLANSGMAGDDLYFDRVEVESMLTNGRCGVPSLRYFRAYRRYHSAHPCLPQLLTIPLVRFSGVPGGFLHRDNLLFTTVPSSMSMPCGPNACRS